MVPDTGWYKSSFSNSGGDACVEIRIMPELVGVRDSKNPTGRSFWVPTEAWASLVTRLTLG